MDKPGPGGSEPPANPKEPDYVASPARLLHELQVHQLELQMQNEELVAARDALTASLARYTDLYDFAPVAYFTIGADAAIRQVNLAGAALLGRAPGDVRGRCLRHFVAPPWLPAFDAFLARLPGCEVKQSCETVLRGLSEPVIVQIDALADPRGDEFRLAAVDLTESRRSAAIRESEQRFQVALGNSPITVFEQDLQLRYTWMHNPMWALPASAIVGRRNAELLDADSAARLDALLLEALATRRASRSEVTLGAAAREPLCWDLSVHLRYGEAGQIVGVIGAATDISERKRSERELQAAKSAAERANDAKSRFLAAASHDLRQPLGAMTLYVDLLRGRSGNSDALLVERIKGCVTSMGVLLNDLLDVSKLTAGVVEPQRADFSVDALLEHLVSVHSAEAELKGLRVRRVASGLTGHSDPVWFGRIVGNLLANAVEYTDNGGVLLACRRHGGRRWVEVRDTGIGIAAHQTAEIFEEFRQLGNSARTHGSGLGLAIVARAADLLGVEVRVRSTPGRGSLFAVELPLGSGAPAGQLRQPAHAPAKPLCIALVEDNAAVLQALACVLESSGHRVVAATSKSGLLQRLADSAPDVVISDYRLPDDETGFDVIRALRQRSGRELPAIILTGDTDPTLMAEMERHGIVIQHKPIDVGRLELCIAQATQ